MIAGTEAKHLQTQFAAGEVVLPFAYTSKPAFATKHEASWPNIEC